MIFANVSNPKSSSAEDDYDVEVLTPQERLEALSQKIKDDASRTGGSSVGDASRKLIGQSRSLSDD